MKITENFDKEEFTCKCGCGYNVIDRGLVEILQRVRSELGVALRVNSGCRCERHNARVGGVKGSYHTVGKAADVSSVAGARKIYEAVQRVERRGEIEGMKYCILYERRGFVHIDVGKVRSKKYEIRG